MPGAGAEGGLPFIPLSTVHLFDHSGYERQGITEFNSCFTQYPVIDTGAETSLLLHTKEVGGGQRGGRTN